MAALVSQMKKKGGDGTYGAVSGLSIVLGELLKHDGGFDAVQVIYRDAPSALNDLLGGRLDYAYLDTGFAMAQARQGKVRILGVSSKTRSEALPEVPTMAEAGYPDVEGVGWFGAFVAPHTPKPIVNQINGSLQKIIGGADTKQFFGSIGAEVFPGSPEEMTALQKEEIERLAVLVRLAKMEAQ